MTAIVASPRIKFGSPRWQHLVHAARYVALNPVRARLCDRAEDWPWSSARAHLAGEDDELVEVASLLARVGDFATFLGQDEDPLVYCAECSPGSGPGSGARMIVGYK